MLTKTISYLMVLSLTACISTSAVSPIPTLIPGMSAEVRKASRRVVMYRAWLGLKARAWAWLWWAWAFKIVSQARIEGLPKPGAWLGLKPGLVYHIW
jgi:hypothetical protein